MFRNRYLHALMACLIGLLFASSAFARDRHAAEIVRCSDAWVAHLTALDPSFDPRRMHDGDPKGYGFIKAGVTPTISHKCARDIHRSLNAGRSVEEALALAGPPHMVEQPLPPPAAQFVVPFDSPDLAAALLAATMSVDRDTVDTVTNVAPERALLAPDSVEPFGAPSSGSAFTPLPEEGMPGADASDDQSDDPSRITIGLLLLAVFAASVGGAVFGAILFALFVRRRIEDLVTAALRRRAYERHAQTERERRARQTRPIREVPLYRGRPAALIDPDDVARILRANAAMARGAND